MLTQGVILKIGLGGSCIHHDSVFIYFLKPVIALSVSTSWKNRRWNEIYVVFIYIHLPILIFFCVAF